MLIYYLEVNLFSYIFEQTCNLYGHNITEWAFTLTSIEKEEKCALYPHSFLPSPHAPYFLKVSVWEINDHSAAEDDSLHKDDIEFISEMLQNWLFDVYC